MFSIKTKKDDSAMKLILVTHTIQLVENDNICVILLFTLALFGDKQYWNKKKTCLYNSF